MLRLTVSYFAILIFTIFSAASAQDRASIGYVAPDYAREQPAQGPSAVYSSGGRLAVADTVARRLRVFETPALNAEMASVLFPEGLDHVVEVQAMGDVITLVDGTGTSWSLDLPEGIEFPADPLPELRGETDADGRVLLSLDGERLDIVKPSEQGAAILDWGYIGQLDGASLVLLNEAAEGDLKARILHLQEQGVETLAVFSWGPFDHIPDRPVHLDAGGGLWIFALKNGVWAHSLEAVMSVNQRLRSAPSRQKHFEDRTGANDTSPLEAVVRQQRAIVDDSSRNRARTDYEVIDEAMLSFTELVEFPLRSAAGIRRQDAVARALAYYTIPFFYRQRNYNDLGNGWQRPTNLEGRNGTWQSGFRYYWSGYMSLRRHQEGVISGNAVGDINTSAIISQGIVGCDCSGCVSAWLGIPRHTTTGIKNDPDDLFEPVAISDLRPGDLLNRGGSHVRMLLNKIEGPSGTSYRVIESAKSCDGVCINVYSATQLGRYTPLTYKKFLD